MDGQARCRLSRSWHERAAEMTPRHRPPAGFTLRRYPRGRHMTLRRVVALAQALTMISLLAPGLDLAGPAPVRAAPTPAEQMSADIFDVEGKGFGCTDPSKFRGPRLPKEPPWPPV